MKFFTGTENAKLYQYESDVHMPYIRFYPAVGGRMNLIFLDIIISFLQLFLYFI